LFSFDQAMSVLIFDRSGLCANSPPRLLPCRHLALQGAGTTDWPKALRLL
jgi:hypothetical protein